MKALRLALGLATLLLPGCRDAPTGGAGGAGGNPCGTDCNGVQLTYVCDSDQNCSCLGATSGGCLERPTSAGNGGAGAHGRAGGLGGAGGH